MRRANRRSLAATADSELRTSIARPEREPSTIAHLLVTESPESLLLATEISERKSCGMLRKNERLKEKLMALGQRLMGGDESCEAEYDK